VNAALLATLEVRLAESRSEWRRLADAAGLDAFLAEAAWPRAAGGGLAAAGLAADGRGATLIDGLIAETGSLILSARHPGARRTAFLAETHFALAAEECLHATLADYLAAAHGHPANGADAPAGVAASGAPAAWRARAGHSLTLIVGPSRTADIEKTLVLGAHGPRRLVVAAAPAALLASRFDPALLAPEAGQ
jgi:L-lactate dehydrogenase complex protein LldG